MREEREVADFVQEQRAPVGEFHPPGLAVVRAGERALLVAEDLRLEERIRERGAADRLEGVAAATAQFVDDSRDHFLTGAGGTEDERRDVRLGNRAEGLQQEDHLLVDARQLEQAAQRRGRVLGAARGGRCEMLVEQLAQGSLLRHERRVSGVGTGDPRREAMGGQFLDAVLDVHTQPGEDLHERVDFERLVAVGVEVPQERGPKRRLHQRAEPVSLGERDRERYRLGDGWIGARGVSDRRHTRPRRGHSRRFAAQEAGGRPGHTSGRATCCTVYRHEAHRAAVNPHEARRTGPSRDCFSWMVPACLAIRSSMWRGTARRRFLAAMAGSLREESCAEGWLAEP